MSAVFELSNTKTVNIIKVTIFPKLIYRFTAILMKIPMAFYRNVQAKLKIHIEVHRKPKIILNKVRGFIFLCFKNYYKGTVIKTRVLE